MAAVEGFSTSSYYLFKALLPPTHMENPRAGNGDVSACLQVLSLPKPNMGVGLSGEQCALRATVSFRR